jgi:hypothetical protein
MNIGRITLVWLLANVCIGLVVLIFALLDDDMNTITIESVFSLAFIGTSCTIPSLIALIIFQAIYKATVKTPKRLHYVLVVFSINLLYFLYCNVVIDLRFFKEYYLFFILTTISGIASLLILYKPINPVYTDAYYFAQTNTNDNPS